MRPFIIWSGFLILNVLGECSIGGERGGQEAIRSLKTDHHHSRVSSFPLAFDFGRVWLPTRNLRFMFEDDKQDQKMLQPKEGQFKLGLTRCVAAPDR